MINPNTTRQSVTHHRTIDLLSRPWTNNYINNHHNSDLQIIIIVQNKETRPFILEGQIIETIWTIAPADTLVFIAVPYLRLLCLIDEIHNPVITLKAAGHQWYWSYEYSDFTKLGVAQRVRRGIALLFHDRGTRRGWVVISTPWPHFTPRKDPAPILQEAAWAPGPVWTGGKSRPDRDSIPDRPARSQSLYRLLWICVRKYKHVESRGEISLD